MATVTINNPQIFKLTALTDNASFVPYGDNFTVGMEKDSAIEFEIKASGEALYYTKLATKDLGVELKNAYDTASESIIVIKPNSIVHLTNATAEPISFVPYKQNFTVAVEGGNTLNISAFDLNQCLYYVKAASQAGLAVSYDAPTEE